MHLRTDVSMGGTNRFRRVRLFALLTLVLAGQSAMAMPMNWQLENEDGYLLGTLLIDFMTEQVSQPQISGDLGTYTIVSSFVFLDTSDFVGPERVHDYILLFSPESGKVYRSDYGDGEYNEIKVNESTLQIGTLTEALNPVGGRFPVIINEVYNFDEINQYCDYYEEYYDPDSGEFLGTGPCSSYRQDAYFNLDVGYWYYGFLSALQAQQTLPAPGTALLLLAGIAVLARASDSGGRSGRSFVVSGTHDPHSGPAPSIPPR